MLCVRVINQADENQRNLLHSARISRREQEVLRMQEPTALHFRVVCTLAESTPLLLHTFSHVAMF